MKKFLQKKLNNEKGMTLIELLAVIVIIAIIAAIAIPAIGGIIENSRVGAVKSDAVNILNASKLYSAEGNPKAVISLGELETLGFIDDAGTFEKVADKTKVTVDTTTNRLTGASDGDNKIVLTFGGASLAEINELRNGTGQGATNTAKTVTVTTR